MTDKPVSKEKQLDDLDEQISALEDKRKELKLEIEKEEVFEKILSGEIEEAWGYLREFGSHTAACLSGALVGEKRPHPLCTCGWNHVATEAERTAR